MNDDFTSIVSYNAHKNTSPTMVLLFGTALVRMTRISTGGQTTVFQITDDVKYELYHISPDTYEWNVGNTLVSERVAGAITNEAEYKVEIFGNIGSAFAVVTRIF